MIKPRSQIEVNVMGGAVQSTIWPPCEIKSLERVIRGVPSGKCQHRLSREVMVRVERRIFIQLGGSVVKFHTFWLLFG